MFKKVERLNKKLLDTDNKLMRVVEYYGHDDYPSVGRYCMKCGGNVPI